MTGLPEIELSDLLKMPELTGAVVAELGARWDGVVSGALEYEGRRYSFRWVDDEDLVNDLKAPRTYMVYDGQTIIGRVSETLVNSFRATDGDGCLKWELRRH